MINVELYDSYGSPKLIVLLDLFSLAKERTPIAAEQDLTQLELANRWFGACIDTHTSCKPTEGHQLPTRLIDVGCTPSRLVLTSNLPNTTRPKYATLSHCWGSGDFLKLEGKSLKHFLEAIPEDKLGKTCRDAIYITRNLGIQYLWIDSLCIIQGSEKYWAHESLLMGSVYGGSNVTIAADGAIDGTEGCFLKPHGYIDKVRVKPSKSETWDLCFDGNSMFDKYVNKSHLSSRAWALQERLLSTRTLHFTQTGLYWECRYCDASETFTEGLSKNNDRNKFNRERRPLLFRAWPSIIESYIAAKLTFERDRMVAIAGLAKIVQNENDDQYFAGLWRKDIELQLIWKVMEPRQKKADYRGPSWSWASICGQSNVGFHQYYYPREENKEYSFFAHAQEAHVVSVGDDVFRELAGGMLKFSISAMLAGKISVGWSGSKVIEVDSLDDKKEAFDINLSCIQLDGEAIYLLPVVDIVYTNPDFARSRTVAGILLLQSGVNKGEYIHAGSFNVLGWEEPGFLPDKRVNFLHLLESFGQATAEAQCSEILSEPKVPDERYAITII